MVDRGMGRLVAGVGLICGVVMLVAGCRQQAIPGRSAKTSAGIAPAPTNLTLQKVLRAKRLRGYGTVSGKFYVADGIKGGAVLEIACQSPGKAQLLQAKYLSDLTVLPGVTRSTVRTARGSLRAYQARGQGELGAVRAGRYVFILAAPSAASLVALYEKNLPDSMHLDGSQPEVAVPMYLNRWDRCGFRFYYVPFYTQIFGPRLKNGRPMYPHYNPMRDFEFARRCNHAGLLLWQPPENVPAAAGIMDANRWSYVGAAAEKLGLPIGVNDSSHQSDAWVLNRYPGMADHYEPGFTGTWTGPFNGTSSVVSWNATAGRDLVLGEQQACLRRLLARYHNITSFLNVGGEVPSHQGADVLSHYGPPADHMYRVYLRHRYGAVAALNKHWGASYSSWSQVHVPQLASFLGWGKRALNLGGPWRISYTAPYGAASASPMLNDASWPVLEAPGDQLALFMSRKPAVFRRHIFIPRSYLAGQKRLWLYVLDFNDTRNGGRDRRDRVLVFVNGHAAPEDPPVYAQAHWAAVPVRRLVRAGSNVITICLPQGILDYRVYLSPERPRCYPDLPGHMDARWADFAAWVESMRVRNTRRGLKMIRQVAPNQGIMLMAPDSYLDGLLTLAGQYGVDFHNTGYMAGWWCDQLPALARSVGMCCSAEPGSPAQNVPELKQFFGRWLTEGVNGIDYFMDVGDILFHPRRRQCFLKNLEVYTSIGKYHCPVARVAALYSGQRGALTSFPWNAGYFWTRHQSDPYRHGGYVSSFDVRALISPVENIPPLPHPYDSDAVTEASFARRDVNQYRVIIDANTTYLTAKTVAGIKKYVQAGGVFVAYGQTGRNSPTRANAWMLQKLTGYRVLKTVSGTLTAASGRKLFAGLPKGHYYGLSLKKIAPDAIDLLRWNNGSVAVGMRKLGKGYIMYVGPWGYGKGMSWIFNAILQWRQVKPIAASLTPQPRSVLWRRYVSNNGLYDVWVVWNKSSTAFLRGRLGPVSAHAPRYFYNLRTGKRQAMVDGRVPVDVGPLDTDIYLTLRDSIAEAPLRWFELQRRWWAGVGAGQSFPDVRRFKPRMAKDLTHHWAFEAMKKIPHDIQALASPTLDDASWQHRNLGIFTIPNHRKAHFGIFRKWFTVPRNWRHGHVALWMKAPAPGLFLGHGEVYMDGRRINQGGLEGNALGGRLRAGSRHLLAIAVYGKGPVLGVSGIAWLAYRPDPIGRESLHGAWRVSTDGLIYRRPQMLPGACQGDFAKRAVTVPARYAADHVVLHISSGLENMLNGVVINGHYVGSAYAGWAGPFNRMNINISPWVKFGRRNSLVLVTQGPCKLRHLSLDFYRPHAYP